MNVINTDVWRLRTKHGIERCEVAASSLQRAIEVAVAHHPPRRHYDEDPDGRFGAGNLASVERMLVHVLVDRDELVEGMDESMKLRRARQLVTLAAARGLVVFMRGAHLEAGLQVHDDGEDGMGLTRWEVGKLLRHYAALAEAVDALDGEES